MLFSFTKNLPKGCTSNPYCPKPPPPPADDSFDDNAEGPIHPDGPVTKRPRMRAPQEAQARAPWDASRANELVRESNSNAQSFFFGDVRPGANGGSRGLPPGYVCRICNVPGHHIRDCPQASGAPRVSSFPFDLGSHFGESQFLCVRCRFRLHQTATSARYVALLGISSMIVHKANKKGQLVAHDRRAIQTHGVGSVLVAAM